MSAPGAHRCALISKSSLPWGTCAWILTTWPSLRRFVALTVTVAGPALPVAESAITALTAAAPAATPKLTNTSSGTRSRPTARRELIEMLPCERAPRSHPCWEQPTHGLARDHGERYQRRDREDVRDTEADLAIQKDARDDSAR